jgi:hypothetical protein
MFRRFHVEFLFTSKRFETCYVTLTYTDEVWEIKSQIDCMEYVLAMEINDFCVNYINEHFLGNRDLLMSFGVG